MTVASGTALRLVELFHYHELALLMACYHHLGNALAVFDHEILLREVDEQHAHLSAIVGIDGSRRVQHRDAMLQSQSAARAHLCLVSLGKRDEKARFHQFALKRMQRQRFIEIGAQVHSGALRRSIGRQLLMPTVHNFYFQHIRNTF